jgi:hypothetical protein
MDQFIGSHKLATYLHPGPSGPFLELKNEPVNPPSPSTSALLQHNPSLIDLCTFNSLYQRLAENSPSSNNTSPYKQFVTPSSDLYFSIPPMPQIECPQQSTNMPDTTASPISSAGECSPNVSSCTSTPYSSPKVKHLLQQNSPLDLCLTKDYTSEITKKHRPNASSHRDSNENISNCELSGKIKKKIFVFLIFFEI